MNINRSQAKTYLQNSDFKGLFLEMLGWNRADEMRALRFNEQTFDFHAFAQQSGVTAYACRVSDVAQLDYQTRSQIERAAATNFPSHLFVFFDEHAMVWQWSRRELNQPRQLRSVGPFGKSSSLEPILQKLDGLAFDIEEENIQAADVDARLKKLFNVEPVTRNFYRQFEQEYESFLAAITGIGAEYEREWASLMLNRLMFLYFMQRKQFLLGQSDYLKDCFNDASKRVAGKDDYLHGFLAPLFFEILSVKRDNRSTQNIKIFGDVIYLNGGLFSQRDWEKSPKISVPDSAFEKIFAFFDKWNWHLDERPTRSNDEINPDVLGYVFEKFINQRQMGAYYTKEDITGYISKNTVLPFLFESSGLNAKRPLELLADNIERYIYPAVKHGCDLPLPAEIEAGIDDVAQRGEWNKTASAELGLPTEIWRETVARRQRFAELTAASTCSALAAVSDLITHNLDIEQWFVDVIADISDADELELLWTALQKVTILDPTVGSGAFLFAAMGVLQPVYSACLERMDGFVADAEARAQKQAFKAATSFESFRDVLREIDSHPNRNYAIYKKLAVQNLFGVDIMPEASEICKLRLFLKLAAQVSPDASAKNLGIEPLPDIDFNIRAGNTLVGFASLQEVEKAAVEQMSFGVTPQEIEAEMQRYGSALDGFRAAQLEGGSVTQQAKTNLQTQHDTLVEKLDAFNAGLYGKMPKSDPKKYAEWKASHQPFHWCAEFYSVIKAGGFDVIIGNPPYVAMKKIEYSLRLPEISKFSDIYGHVILRSFQISQQKSWTCMIVTLSLNFSQDFSKLRSYIFGIGSSYFSSFDNIPAALFAGVSQRCTIFICNKKPHSHSYVAPMYRWRSSTRASLFENLNYTPIKLENRLQCDIPKLQSATQANVLSLIGNAAKQAYGPHFRLGDRTGKGRIMFSQAARNFISTFVEAPPYLDEISLKAVESSKIGGVTVRNNETGFAALAMLSGDLYFWYWLVRGDGFDITSWIVSDFLTAINAAKDEDFAYLIELGKVLHSRRNEALVFKKNAGKYVGNYNYRHLSEITRRADLSSQEDVFRYFARSKTSIFAGFLLPHYLVTLKTLGATKAEALEVFDYVQRILSINESAGEKAIPLAVKKRFAIQAVDKAKQKLTFDKIDRVLAEHYGFTPEELDFIINYDIKYRMGRDAGDD